MSLSFLCVRGDEMNVIALYECAACNRTYEHKNDAQYCCEPIKIFNCICGKFYRDAKEANDCCQEKPIDEEKEPFDFISFGDEHD